MSPRVRLLLLWLILCVGVLALSGCTTPPRTQVVYVPTPVPAPCKAAQSIPAEPPETLELAGLPPVDAARRYAANRASWIGHARELRPLLEACR